MAQNHIWALVSPTGAGTGMRAVPGRGWLLQDGLFLPDPPPAAWELPSPQAPASIPASENICTQLKGLNFPLVLGVNQNDVGPLLV